MTPRRFPPPWRADKIPGGYVVRYANAQALMYIYSRDNETEALQAKVLTKHKAGGSPSMWRGCRSDRKAGYRYDISILQAEFSSRPVKLDTFAPNVVT